jgi:hypothetical protein
MAFKQNPHQYTPKQIQSTLDTVKRVSTVQKPLITSNRAETARSIRTTQRQNSDNTVSTHKMESGEGGGKYKYQVNPTIFPEKDGTWKDLGNNPNKNAAYEEAKKRGEVFGFKSKRKAEKFAAGSWKKGDDRKDAMKNYREDKKQQRKSK